MKENSSRKTYLLGAAGAIFIALLCFFLSGSIQQGEATAKANAVGKTATVAASNNKALPKTKVVVPKGKAVATLAAGCFWAVEAMFNQLKGVEKVEPGYAGGSLVNPSYEQVCTDTTGHAETVNIIFDPKQISYGELVKVILTVTDPTTLNRQGPDVGTHYRSAIFYHNDAQKQAAQEAIREVTAARIWKDPIVTTVVPFANFYRAEDYHFNYYSLNPNQPYCQMVVRPKIEKFHKEFKDQLKQ
jgi:peptide-methionine (S)-S-oxide reductase